MGAGNFWEGLGRKTNKDKNKTKLGKLLYLNVCPKVLLVLLNDL